MLVEIVFARPGLGRLVLDAINARNYPVLQGAVLVVVVLFVVTNLLVDLLYVRARPPDAAFVRRGVRRGVKPGVTRPC